MKPVLGATTPPKAGRPQPGRVPQKEKWVFSFRFWRQIDNFQIGDVPHNWFVSLLNRLAEMSRIDKEDIFRDTVMQDAIRFHVIDWDAKNVPLKRADIDWLEKDILDNEAEFPFYQFHVSKALGRIVGFFDENQIFNIVLLDPNHNLQPSKFNDYRIRPTVAGACQFSQVVTVAQSYVGGCTNPDCTVKHGIVEAIEVETRKLAGGVMIVNMTEETSTRLGRIVGTGAASSFDEIIEYALVELESMLPDE